MKTIQEKVELPPSRRLLANATYYTKQWSKPKTEDTEKEKLLDNLAYLTIQIIFSNNHSNILRNNIEGKIKVEDISTYLLSDTAKSYISKVEIKDVAYLLSSDKGYISDLSVS